MEILKKGDCEHCGRTYHYSLWHCGFGETSYAYCDLCGMLALLNYSNRLVAALPPLSAQFKVIDEEWEPFLRPCECGGTFRTEASPRCPHCHSTLSAGYAAGHLQRNSTGAGRGWHWQGNWTGMFCIAIEDPKRPGAPLQTIDPLLELHATPEVAKAKRRWGLLLSLNK